MIRVSYEVAPPAPPPPVTFVIRSTEGHGTWTLTETEARQLFTGLRDKITALDARRDRESGETS